MKAINRKAILSGILVSLSSFLPMAGAADASTAEEPDLLYTLDPIVATAARYEKKN